MQPSRSKSVPWRHILLAIIVVGIWGTNFTVIRVALDTVPPLSFATLRFFFAALPCMFFLPRPRVRAINLAAYGLLIGAGNFGLLFLAMRGSISPGLASLVIQTQVFFTIGIAMIFDGDRPQGYQVAGLLLGLAGLAMIGGHVDTATTPLGIILVLLAALCWAAGNIVARRSGATNMLAYVVWSSPFAVAPLAVLSLTFEGAPAIIQGLQHAGTSVWLSILWQSIGNTLFGYAAWAWLLSRYEASSISPLALLVPIFGMATSFVWLGEPLAAWKIAAAGLMLVGLALGAFYPTIRAALTRA